LFFNLTFFSGILPLIAQDRLVDKDNIVWDGASRDAAGSMPCGGGDIGLNVWVENGDLLFYFGQSGSFDENNALLKGGRVRLRLRPNPLEGVVRQELVLHDGSVVVSGRVGAGSGKGAAVKIRVWVDVFRPAVHVDVDGSRPLAADVTYESWRAADRVMEGKANNANSYKWAWRHAPGGQVVTHGDSIRFQDGGVLFYHRNRDQTVFDVTVRQQGLDTVKAFLYNPLEGLTFGGMLTTTGMRPGERVSGRYGDTDFEGWRLVSDRAVRHRELLLVLSTEQVKDVAAWEAGLRKKVADVRVYSGSARQATADWWNAFWRRSFIYIKPDSPDGSPEWQAGRNYQLFRYMLGCNAHGDYPTKFNGGLFTYDPALTDTSLRFTPDFRNWGGGTMTAQNQRLVYWPMLRSGDLDLMRSQFSFYLRSQRAAEFRSRVYWGHGGACFTEQLENFGLPNNAEYGWDMPADHDKGVEYNAWLEYEWDTVLEFCLMMLEEERYKGEGSSLAVYVPFIESCLTFFNEHYQYLARLRGRKTLDGDGHLILYPGSGGETYKMAYDASSTIAGLHTVLSRLLELPAGYLTDSSRAVWTTMLQRLPPPAFRRFDGHVTISPAKVWERINNKECPQLYPVFPWGVYGIGRPGLDTAINTYKYDTDAVRFRSYVGWKQDNIFAARLGLVRDAAALTVEKLRDGPRRFPAFWGPGFDWVPDHNWGGSGMIGLQEMLLQTDGKKIFLFPAWPREWDVHFKLHAPYSTTVEAVLRKGKVELLKVEPASRQQDIINFLR
ncbi:MAG TPA: DUF5703 domain-containing protein, partial [Puia sp.]|nr:DUF5703 domain-containing protein [Puia sp.]